MSKPQNHIITADDIRSYRPVAVNISDTERIDPYITEVEQMYIVPALGAKLYKKLTDTMQEGVSIEEKYQLLKDGGFYAQDTCYFAGLIAAVSYLTYSRMVRNQSANVTAFGVVFKNGDFSEKADEATIARLSNEAQKIGMQHLNDCIAYLKKIEEIPCSTKRVRRGNIRVIN